jgi:hypothetical protein
MPQPLEVSIIESCEDMVGTWFELLLFTSSNVPASAIKERVCSFGESLENK